MYQTFAAYDNYEDNDFFYRIAVDLDDNVWAVGLTDTENDRQQAVAVKLDNNCKFCVSLAVSVILQLVCLKLQVQFWQAIPTAQKAEMNQPAPSPSTQTTTSGWQLS